MTTPAAVTFRTTSGEILPFDIARYHGPSTADDDIVLDAADGPVIDLGCGPGRLVLRLAQRRVPVLGVDSSPAAVALARSRGVPVLERDLFGPLPGEGRWRTALLFDGNIGIGGDPVRLLRRCRALIGGHGRVVVELEPGQPGLRHVEAHIERGNRRSHTFAWAIVGADAIGPLARAVDLVVAKIVDTTSGRRFAHLDVTTG